MGPGGIHAGGAETKGAVSTGVPDQASRPGRDSRIEIVSQSRAPITSVRWHNGSGFEHAVLVVAEVVRAIELAQVASRRIRYSADSVCKVGEHFDVVAIVLGVITTVDAA